MKGKGEVGKENGTGWKEREGKIENVGLFAN